jgi:hypothetical protein
MDFTTMPWRTGRHTPELVAEAVGAHNDRLAGRTA